MKKPKVTEGNAAKEVKRTEHTPGPWVVDSHYPNKVHTWNGHQIAVATADSFTSPERARANARAIAAAPELLKSIKNVLSHNAAIKFQYQLPASLVRELEAVVKQAEGLGE